MKATLSLGRIVGVRVGLHWSVLGIVAILVSLALARWPVVVPGYSWVAYAIAAVTTALLFVGSLLAHELSHAVVARREGVEVGGITLWLLGGIAQLRGDASTPGASLRIAVVGPAMSFLLAVVFGLIALPFAGGDGSLLVAATFGYLGVINLVLAVFNLIPAAPLDGGRILRAALWKWRGDRDKAAVWSARAGRVFGLALITFGAVWLFIGAGADGLWWILIGLFIVTVAGAEEQQAALSGSLRDVRVGDVMTRDPETVDGDRTVADFVRTDVLARKHSAYPIVDSAGGVRGLLTLSRLKRVPADRREEVTLAEIACPPDDIPLTSREESLTDLLPRMAGCEDGRALVVEDGRLIGIVTSRDISHAVSVSDLQGAGGGLHPGGYGADLITGNR
ncbi:site-2 protease family protein [Haloechinothrix halophila]|uniref:site-2 protease family protein n=1 Tax=Haloechinothrix halophila TaxID=1069073 RepID=UPI00041EE2A5|nr:site-2 protease family protein [Haloechinothrix halophila]